MSYSLPLSALSLNSSGQLVFGASIASGAVSSITGTANQVNTSASSGAITLSLPQSIATTSTPSFEGLHLGIAGSVSGILQFFNSGNGNAISLSIAGGASNYSLQFPNLQGGANTFFKNDGTGSLSFSSIVLTTDVSGTLPVANGGTGDASLTAYAVLTGGTTSTGTIQSVSGVGTSGQVLTSNGTSALPTWQTTSGSGTVNSGAAGRLAIYPSSSTVVGDTWIQDSHNINVSIQGQPTRSTDVTYQLLNPGDSVATTNIVTDIGSFTIAGQITFSTEVTFTASPQFALVNSTGNATSIAMTTPAAPQTLTIPDSGSGTANFVLSKGAQTISGALTLSNILTMSGSTIAMGSNKITGLATATTSGDALSYGQPGASVNDLTITGTSGLILGGTNVGISNSGAFGISSGSSLTLSGTSVTLNASTISMNSNKITSLANGTASTDAAAFGQLNVLQSVQSTFATQASSTSTTYADTGITITITPKLSTSHIKLDFDVPCSYSSSTSGGAASIDLIITDNSNTTIQEYIASAGQNLGVAGVSGNQQVHISAWDAPGSTSAKTYKVRFRLNTNQGGGVNTVKTCPSIIGQTTAFIFASEYNQ